MSPSSATACRARWSSRRPAQHPGLRQRRRLELPFSCTSGVCGTCRAKVLEGQVRMERNFALDKNEVAAGYVLTCQAHPITDRVVLSFDAR